MDPRRIMDISADLYALLSAGVPAILLTVDESGFPHTAFSFAAATEARRIAIAVDEGSRTLGNIERTGKASIQFLAPGNIIYLVKGRVHLSPGALTAVPAPLRRAEMQVLTVKNQSWSGVTVAPLEYVYSASMQPKWGDALPDLYAELRNGAGPLPQWSDSSPSPSNPSAPI